ncbi:MAG TPA: YnfA family protein [Thermoanaerobaculia bacterium]|jgi:small multidrug resistance family-3 protein
MNVVWFVIAAALEIGGCYAVWLWARLGRTPLWIFPGVLCLVLFAYALTRVEVSLAGRAFAAYGGIYIVSSLTWLLLVERTRPSVTDVLGGAVSIAGAAIILAGSRP